MAFKISESHWQLLCAFMESHPDFATGKFIGPKGKAVHRQLWEQLSHELNSLGLGTRTVEKWQKSWADLKYSIKKKATLQRQELQATGGGKPANISLSQYEERVLAVLGQTFFEGVGSEECGVPLAVEERKSNFIEETPCKKLKIDVPQFVKVCSTPTIKDTDYQKNIKAPRLIFKENRNEMPNLAEASTSKVLDVSQATHEDHDYVPHNKKKNTQHDKEKEMYIDTINELKLIRQELGDTNKNLRNINNSLQDLKNVFLEKFSQQ